MVLYLLDLHSNMDSEERRDPVRVTRALTEMVSDGEEGGGRDIGRCVREDARKNSNKMKED